MSGGFAFILDDYHHDIKRIDLNTGETIYSGRISGREFPWPTDLVSCGKNILVCDAFDSVFVFDRNLERLKAEFVGGRGNHYMVRRDDDSLLLYYQLSDAIAYLSCDGVASRPWDTVNFSVLDSPHGKKWSQFSENGKHFLQTKYFKLALEKGSSTVANVLDYLECINVDYDSTGLVRFDVRDGKFILYYYERLGK